MFSSELQRGAPKEDTTTARVNGTEDNREMN